MKRAEQRTARQEAHHKAQIARAKLARHKLAAACQYLIAEANRASDTEVNKATEYVLAYVAYLRTPPDQEGTPT